jgi:iron complex transport system ATP-binding protein
MSAGTASAGAVSVAGALGVAGPAHPKIAVERATFAYGPRDIFIDLNFEVNAGEILCLLGANGCGKTTLLRCLSGYLKLREGSVSLDGKNIAGIPATALARRIGFVFQDNIPTFPYSVLEVVRMGRAPHLPFFASPGPEDTKIAERAMENVGISHLRDKKFTEISGGERQLAVIARTLAQEPDVIIMDEPTSALDFRNQTLILRMIGKLASQGLTIVMSSHFPNNALLFSNRVALMHQGRFLAVGDADQVITEENLEDIYGIAVRIIVTADQRRGGSLKFVIPADDSVTTETLPGHESKAEDEPETTSRPQLRPKPVVEAADPGGTARWDAMAEDFERQFSRSDYRDKLMEKLELEPGSTVLDVGCGPGTLSLLLAARAQSVTALDISAGMLAVGERKAQENGVENIHFVRMDWNEAVIGRDVSPHDVVVCSRSLCGRNPRCSLLRLHEAARRRVYLTLKTLGDGSQRFYEDLYRRLGMEYIPREDYMTYYNVLYDLGIRACVDFITYTDSFCYERADDAFRVLNSHIFAQTERQRELLMSYVSENMAANGRFLLDIESRWALLSWEKAEEGEVERAEPVPYLA